MPRTLRFFSLIFCGVLLLLLSPPAREGFPDDRLARAWYRPPEGFDRVEYVLVTGRTLVGAWRPLADWKSQIGVPADIVAVEDILANPLYRGADSPETLRNFLKDLYWKWGLEWVLLGADVNIVPTRFADIMERTACDAYFACLEGTWNEDGDSTFGSGNDMVVQQCDLFLGRVPVETPAEVQAFLTKYFRYIKPLHRDYQKRVLCVGAVIVDDFSCDADDHYEYVKTAYLEPHGFEVVHLEQTDFLRGHFEYDPATKKCSGYAFGPSNKKAGPASRDRMVAEVNKGFGIVTHYAHSNTYALGLPKGMGIRNADVKHLTNAERPSVFYSGGCHVNQFDHESISEELLLHPGGGAVAFIGCTVNSYSYQNLFERDFFEALLRHGEYRIGRVFEASKIRQSARNSRGENPVTVLNRGLALLGDPHMPVWTDAPRDLSVRFQNPSAGRKTLEVLVSDPDGGAVSGARASLWKKGETLVSLLTGGEGKVVLPLPQRGMKDILLTVTARNFVPLEREIAIREQGPGLVPFHVSIEAGGDDVLGVGEKAEIFVAVKNEGGSGAEAVTGSLSSKDPYVRTEPQTAPYPRLEPGEVILPEKGFVFSVARNAPPHHIATFHFRLRTGDATVWEGPLRIPVHTPFLVLSSQVLLKNGKRSLPPLDAEDAGTPVAMEIAIANLGTGPARLVRVRLECPHESIRVKNSTQTFERLDAGYRKTVPVPFELEIGPGFEGGLVEFVLALDHEGSSPREEVFTVREPLKVPKGLKAEAGEVSVYLAWEPVDDTRLAGYVVFRSESGDGPYDRIHLSPVTSSCFEDRDLSSQRTYYYRVCAVDRDLNAGSPSTPVAVSTTFPPLRDWPKKAKSALLHVTVCDIDGDGDLEIASADDKGGLWIWHHTGAEFRHGGDNWTFGLFKEFPEGCHSPTFADLDGDGKMEVLTAGRHGDRKVYVFNLDAEPLPGWPKTAKGRLMTPPQVADLDRDGNLEIVFHEGFGANLYVWRRDGSAFNTTGKGKKKKPKPVIGKTDPYTYFLSSIVDLDGDGVKDIVGIGGRGNVYAFRPDGTLHEGFPVPTGKILGSTAPVGDLDGDGRPEIVFVSDGGTRLYALNADGKIRKFFPVNVCDRKPAEGQSLPILADIDGKKGLEIVLGGRDNRVFVVNAQGKNLPGFPRTLPKEACGSAAGDIDGDGAMEIVVGCVDGNVYGFHHDGSPIRGFPLRTGGPVRGAPAIADVDGDGDVEVLAGSADGYLHIWDLGGQSNPGTIAWPMYGGNPARTGVVRPPPKPPSNVTVRGTVSARISWRAPKTGKRAGIRRYHVYRGDGDVLKRLTKTPIKGLSHLDRSIVPGRPYVYAVTAVDSGGRESVLTEPLSWGEEGVEALFEKGRKFENRKLFNKAIRTFEELLKTYPESRFAPKARERLDALQSDAGVQADLEKRRIDSWCRGMLGLARTWEKSGKKKKAAECCRKVIERYPNTPWADKAKKALEALEGK